MTATTDLRTFAGAAPESDELLSFRRDIFINRRFAPLAGQADLRVGGLQGSDSVSTQHPPLKPLPDPIPLKIQFPISKPLPDPIPLKIQFPISISKPLPDPIPLKIQFPIS